MSDGVNACYSSVEMAALKKINMQLALNDYACVLPEHLNCSEKCTITCEPEASFEVGLNSLYQITSLFDIKITQHLLFNASFGKINRAGLKTLPDEINSLTAMTYVNFHIFTIKSLKSHNFVDLGYNSLTSLPANLNSLAHLERLRLEVNGLREFPAGVLTLPSLKSLDEEQNDEVANHDIHADV